MITSRANDLVKHVRSLGHKRQRNAHREFVVEGTRIVEEAERAGLVPALVLFEPQAVYGDPRARAVLARLEQRARAVYSVSPSVLESLAETETPQGLVAVYPMPDLALPTLTGLVLILDAVRDPGNLGTILRTAWAAGVDAVMLAPDTVDLFIPKVVRAAMGAHFFLPVASRSWDEISRQLSGVPRIYLADVHGGQDYASVDWSRPCALIIGGEAEGASAEARGLATALVSIPMPGRAESLNAGVAAGVLLFQANRR